MRFNEFRKLGDKRMAALEHQFGPGAESHVFLFTSKELISLVKEVGFLFRCLVYTDFKGGQNYWLRFFGFLGVNGVRVFFSLGHFVLKVFPIAVKFIPSTMVVLAMKPSSAGRHVMIEGRRS